MAKLSSAFVELRVASEYDVQQALARQVLYGGDLATNLIEVAQVSEAALNNANAAAHGMLATNAGPIPAPEADTLALIPGDLALRFNVYPIGREKEELVIAVTAPLDSQVLKRLENALGLKLATRLALGARIRQAISRDYGLPLDKRSDRVLAKLEGNPDPLPSAPPPGLNDAPGLSGMPRPPTIPPIGLPKAERGEAKAGAPVRTQTAPLGTAPVVGRAPIPVTPAASSTQKGFPAVAATTTPSHAGAHATQRAFPPPPSEPPPEVTPLSQVEASPRSPDAAAPLSDRHSQQPIRPQKRHRGPYTPALAEYDLRHANSTSEVLAAFFDFACQYFEYSAIFAVHGDIAEGRDSHGPGLDRGKITAIGVPLDLPSALSKARTEGKFLLTRLASDGLDKSLAGDLLRQARAKVLVLPISVRGRCVLLFYGDDGKETVKLSEVGEVLALAPLVSTSLERILVARKRAKSATAGDARRLPSVAPKPKYAPPPPPEQRAEALAQALDPISRPKGPRPSPEPNEATAGHTPPPPAERVPAQSAPDAAGAAPKPQSSIPASFSSSIPTSSGLSPSQIDEIRSLTAIVQAGLEVVPGTLIQEVPPGPERRPIPEDVIEDDWEIPEDPLPQRMRGPSLKPSPRAERKSTPVGGNKAAAAPGPPMTGSSGGATPSALLARVLEGSWEAGESLGQLGMQALGTAMQQFPGPITHEQRGAEQASLAGPLLALLQRQGADAAPFVIVRTGDNDPNVRRWATLLLGEIPTPAGVSATAKRLLDENALVRRAALNATHRLAGFPQTRPAMVDALCGMMTNRSMPEDDRLVVLEALVELRCTEAVPHLIPLLDGSASLAESVNWALSSLTRQDFGPSRASWNSWWQRHSSEHRVQWMIDALTHDKPELRRAAAEELERITGLNFKPQGSLESIDRAREFQAQCRQWWETTGRDTYK